MILGYFLVIISALLTSCQKSSELKNPQVEQIQQIQIVARDGTQPGSLTSERINVVQNPMQFAVQISEYNQFEKMIVKVTHWNYNNGHTPMIITNTKTYDITDSKPNQSYTNRNYTGFSYIGAMQVDIYRDTTQIPSYTRYVVLTDSVGWTINLDTAQVSQQGWVGQNRISDVVPKSYQ